MFFIPILCIVFIFFAVASQFFGLLSFSSWPFDNLLVGLLSIFTIWLLRKTNTEHLEQHKIIINKFAQIEERLTASINNVLNNQERHINSASQNSAQQMQNAMFAQKNQLDVLHNQLNQIAQLNENKIENMRNVLSEALNKLQGENSKKLEEIRVTVEEKLQSTLEKRLSESFKLVSDRLEVVHKGLGEMQVLASGVGDLKRVLTNVKTRGIWGEVQLDAILQQIMMPDQYESNVAVKERSQDRVEYAIKLPGKDEKVPIWLPIDAKFPLEDYQRLVEAQESGSIADIDIQRRMLETSLKKAAKMISEKYINPPTTTDFAIMFLPIEGLFAEALRCRGIIESMQRDYRIVLTGPTTLGAILNSLQMGFRAIAIEKHTSNVWRVLDSIKPEFTKFADLLGKTRTKLEQASQAIGDAEVKTRTIQRNLEKASMPGLAPQIARETLDNILD